MHNSHQKTTGRQIVFIATIVLSCLGLSLLNLLQSPITNFANTATGQFEISEGRIYDPNGNLFINKGVNMFAAQTTTQLNSIADCWGFNTIRVPAYLLGSYGQPHPNADNYANFDNIVQAFTSRGIVVVFDAHDRIGSYYEGADYTVLADFWRDMADRYNNNTYVWFDLSNEPDTNLDDTNKWVTYHQELIEIIRDQEMAENIILVEGTSWGQDAGSWDNSLIQTDWSAILSRGSDILNFNNRTYENIAFSIHIYEQWNGGLVRMNDYFDRIEQNGFAFVIGEYGSQNNQDSTIQATQYMFQALEGRPFGRIAWVWEADDNNDLTVAEGGDGHSIDGCSEPTNLTTLGQLVWNDLRSAQFLSSASSNWPLSSESSILSSPSLQLTSIISQQSDNSIVSAQSESSMYSQQSQVSSQQTSSLEWSNSSQTSYSSSVSPQSSLQSISSSQSSVTNSDAPQSSLQFQPSSSIYSAPSDLSSQISSIESLSTRSELGSSVNTSQSEYSLILSNNHNVRLQIQNTPDTEACPTISDLRETIIASNRYVQFEADCNAVTIKTYWRDLNPDFNYSFRKYNLLTNSQLSDYPAQLGVELVDGKRTVVSLHSVEDNARGDSNSLDNLILDPYTLIQIPSQTPGLVRSGGVKNLVVYFVVAGLLTTLVIVLHKNQSTATNLQ